jgi:hypothetical protein
VPGEETACFVDAAIQEQDVVARQEQGVHLGELLDGRALGVGHHLSQGVQGLVHVMHALALPGVDAESLLLGLIVNDNRPPHLSLEADVIVIIFLVLSWSFVNGLHDRPQAT